MLHVLVKIGNIIFEDFPILLAPMEDVSDPPFRRLCKMNGADMMYTEFISSEGLIRDAAKSKQKLDIFEYERPIGVQLFGGDEEAMVQAAQIAEQVNPDLIDINYGCPVKKVVCKMAGAALLKDVDKMSRLTSMVVKAVKLPVTVKTRLGWDDKSKNILEVALRLQDVGIRAITVHGRTRVQMYKGEADWTLIGELKSCGKIFIPVFGNGDVDSPFKALTMKNKYGVDGIMIGRASIGYPWIFREVKHFLKTGSLLPPPTLEERIEAVKMHLDFSIEWKGEKLGILEMRRHYANYFKGFPNFKPYRMRLVTSNLYDEIIDTLNQISHDYAGFQTDYPYSVPDTLHA
ncbi:MAG: tRNA-dihydrouridine synthase [Vicingaceae bacterium]|nr:MAG: tRNA-dihydrouridine synthase [Vicingaceae bacterium]